MTLLEITSGLADDSREADEREEARRLRDLRGRVKAARALVATKPGLVDTLVSDWRRAAMFYERLGITEAMLRLGVPEAEIPGIPHTTVGDALGAELEARERGLSILPNRG